MLKHQSLVLEARVNTTDGKDPCSRCGRWQERTAGMTETYLADTEEWVCPDCAFQLDPKLARFAYSPDLRPKRKRFKRDQSSDTFGSCPECGDGAGIYLNISPSQWCSCERHGLKWLSGINVVGCWKLETMDDWRRNAELLSRFREVEPHYSKGTPLNRMILRVQLWNSRLHRALAKLRSPRADIESDDDLVPF